jgi:hypothetical protein
MMIADIIARIREQCPDFQYVSHVFVGGAAMATPAALVTPVRHRAAAPFVFGPSAYCQKVSMIFGVYIVIGRQENGDFDQGAADQFDDLTSSVRDALTNWQAPGLIAPVIYAGGEIAPYEAGLVAWREDFSGEFELRIVS